MNAFSQAEGVYTLGVSSGTIVLTLSQVLRSKDGLTGTLRVSTTHPFVRTTNGVVAQGKINLLAPTTLKQWATTLAERFHTTADDTALPWGDWLHELSVRVADALASGPPPVDLSDAPPVGPMGVTVLPGGLVTLDHHPMIIAGDGEVGKSTLAMWMAGVLAGSYGRRVLYVDWETDEQLARQTLWRLFGPTDVPLVHYYHARSGGAIWDQREALKAYVKLFSIDYAFFDSVMPAIAGSDGTSADAATGRYFSEVHALKADLGSTHLAHVAKTAREDEKQTRRPTAHGSVFWHNLARVAYFAQADDDGTSSRRTVGLLRTKGGVLSKRRVHDLALDFTYDDTAEPEGTGRIDVTVGDLLAHPDLAQRVSYATRIQAFLRRDTHTTDQIAEHLYGDAEEKNLDRARALLNKLAKASKVVQLHKDPAGGRGRTARWGNATFHHETEPETGT